MRDGLMVSLLTKRVFRLLPSMCSPARMNSRARPASFH